MLPPHSPGLTKEKVQRSQESVFVISLGGVGLGILGLGALSVTCGQKGAAESCWRGVLISQL